MKYITGKHIVLGLLAAVLMLLTGCQADSSADGADTPRQTATMEMQAYATTYNDAMPKASTRVGEWVPTGFTLYEGHDAIRLAFTQVKEGVSSIAKCYNPEIPAVNEKDANGVFSFQNGKWGSSIYLPTTGNYYLYGFMSNEGILDLTPVTGGYNAGANLNITGLPTATSHDICVIVGVKKGESATDGSGIQVGQFGYTIDGASNHVFLLCDHLYACLRLRISVNATYNALRTIKLKKLWVKDCKNINGSTSTPFKSKTNVEINLLSNTTSPIQSWTFSHDDTSAGLNMEGRLLFESNAENDGELKVMVDKDDLENCLEIKGYMAPPMIFASSPSEPIGITDFTLVSQYDIYDKNGNLIRKDQTAENKINIDKVFDPDDLIDRMSMQRGTRYTIYLTVNPTYLYMMSEPDLDNPTIEIVGGGS